VHSERNEAFGLPLVEAMHWRISRIASDTSSVAEIAWDAALLVYPNYKDAITQAFGQMTENEPLRQELSQKGKYVDSISVGRKRLRKR
jgi:glycosyltransferase involved in cell wall biosynthesis